MQAAGWAADWRPRGTGMCFRLGLWIIYFKWRSFSSLWKFWPAIGRYLSSHIYEYSLHILFHTQTKKHLFKNWFVKFKGAGDANRNGTTVFNESESSTTPTNEQKERRLSRDIGTQAYSIEFENERTNRRSSGPRTSTSIGTNTRENDDELFIKQGLNIYYFI